jgi:TPR repeat protein
MILRTGVLFTVLLALQFSALWSSDYGLVNSGVTQADFRAEVIDPNQGADDYTQLNSQLPPSALQGFENRAAQEDQVALDVVFFAHLNGLGTDVDWNKARVWLDKAWHAGTPLGALYHGRNLLGYELDATCCEDTYGKHLVEAAEYRFAEFAKSGDPVALYFLGVCREQLGDAKGAFDYYSRAAGNGCVLAQCQLGICYIDGIGVSKDSAAALRWLLPAAELGLPQAADALGRMYFDGDVLPKDDALALRWTRIAALRGWPHAQHRLAVLYQLGRGIAQNDSSAAEWFEKSAQLGYLPAQLQLAQCYADGIGVVRSDEDAAEWFRKAALQHDRSAEQRVGELFAAGRGVLIDQVEARHWLLVAAQHELRESATQLASAPATVRHALAEPRATDTRAEVLEADMQDSGSEAGQRWYVSLENPGND